LFFCQKLGSKALSQARYTSQHYNPKSSNSNLAKSLLKYRDEFDLMDIDEDSIKLTKL